MNRFTLSAVLFLVALGGSAVHGQEIELEAGGARPVVDGTNSADEITVEYNSRRTHILVTIKRRSSGAVLASRSVAASDLAYMVIYGHAGNDLIRNDTDIRSIVRGGSGRDTIYGGSAADELHGGTGDDTIYGGADNDLLAGDDGADRLFGEGGDDLLVGGRGEIADFGNYGRLELRQITDVHSDAYADQMDGGAGYDVFAFEPNDARVGVYQTSVAWKHQSIWWNPHAWPRNGGLLNPVRVWQIRG